MRRRLLATFGVLIVLAATCLQAAITVDKRSPGSQTLAGNVTAATSISWTHTLGAALSNSILVVGSSQDSNANSTGVNWDDGASNLALTRKGSVTTGTVRAEIWYVIAPTPTGAKTIKESWTGSHDGNGASASYAGVDQTTIFNAASPQTNTGASGNSTLSVTTTSGEMSFDVATKDLGGAGSAPTKGASQNYVGADVDTSTSTIETGVSDQASVGASVTNTWTLPATGAWAAVGVSLLQASAGAVTTQKCSGLLLTGVGCVEQGVR